MFCVCGVGFVGSVKCWLIVCWLVCIDGIGNGVKFGRCVGVILVDYWMCMWCRFCVKVGDVGWSGGGEYGV